MLKKLLGRHRSLRIGATILGASALAIGFASPAFAAQNVNNGNADNANAQNYLIVRGWFEHRVPPDAGRGRPLQPGPGCDLVGQTSTGRWRAATRLRVPGPQRRSGHGPASRANDVLHRT